MRLVLIVDFDFADVLMFEFIECWPNKSAIPSTLPLEILARILMKTGVLSLLRTRFGCEFDLFTLALASRRKLLASRFCLFFLVGR